MLSAVSARVTNLGRRARLLKRARGRAISFPAAAQRAVHLDRKTSALRIPGVVAHITHGKLAVGDWLPTMNILQWIALSGAGVVGSLLVALFALQEHLLYHPNIPTRDYPELPTDYAMPYEDVEIVTADGVKLHAWLILQPGETSKTSPQISYFHGNAGSISHRLMDVRQFYMSGFNMLVVSYRGYGQSEGKPNERGFKLDAAAAIDYVADRTDVLDPKKLFLFGRSIGGAVALAAAAIEAADRNRIRGVVVENTFTSVGYATASANRSSRTLATRDVALP